MVVVVVAAAAAAKVVVVVVINSDNAADNDVGIVIVGERNTFNLAHYFRLQLKNCVHSNFS